MLLRDMMWELFQSTGQIGAYLAYRECVNCTALHPEAVEITQSQSESNVV